MQSHTPWRPPAGLCSCRSDDDGSTRPYTTFSSLSAFQKCVGSVASPCASLCFWICLGEYNSARAQIPLAHPADIDSISRSTIILPATFVYVSAAGFKPRSVLSSPLLLLAVGVPHRCCRHREIGRSYHRYRHDRRRLWSSSGHLYPQARIYVDRLDDRIHPCVSNAGTNALCPKCLMTSTLHLQFPHLQLCTSAIFVLEHGRRQLG